MSKSATIASLVRNAARSEAEFYETITSVFEENDLERAAEFFDKLNVPRSTGAEGGLLDDIPDVPAIAMNVGSFEEEHELGNGIQRYMDRHERKIKWHAGHPSAEGCENVLLVLREGQGASARARERRAPAPARGASSSTSTCSCSSSSAAWPSGSRTGARAAAACTTCAASQPPSTCVVRYPCR